MENADKSVYVTQEILNQGKEDTLAIYHVRATLENIHGDWAKKQKTINGTVWDCTDNEEGTEAKVTGDRESSLDSTKTTKTTKKRAIVKDIHAFPTKDGHVLIPLGGPRGYICGMFRAAARTRGWNKQGNKYWGALSFIDNGGLLVEPQLVQGPTEDEVKTRPFFVKEAKGEVWFEYVEKAPVEFSVSVMKSAFPEDMTPCLLRDLQRLPIGPKRRGTLKITSITKQ
jgi:hypothetical protein